MRSPPRNGQPGVGFEVTPEMIEAGVEALGCGLMEYMGFHELLGDEKREIVIKIIEATYARSPARP
jgi:predicted Ser/Thr protein kinase